jgi:DNA polymerase III subunit epsilon
MRQIVLDTETTGREISEGHRIIEIACLEMVDRRFTKNHFHTYVNPDRDSESGALAIHGLTRSFLQDKPLFAAIANELIGFIKNAELIIHNAPFDLAFLNHELKLINSPAKIGHFCQVTDTLPLARQLHPGQRNSLDALCKRYQIDNSKRDRHSALLDAELLARVYLAMTGGQTDLFDGGQNYQPALARKKNKCMQNLYVLPATYEELREHEKFLTLIREAASNCLWQHGNQKEQNA